MVVITFVFGLKNQLRAPTEGFGSDMSPGEGGPSGLRVWAASQPIFGHSVVVDHHTEYRSFSPNGHPHDRRYRRANGLQFLDVDYHLLWLD